MCFVLQCGLAEWFGSVLLQCIVAVSCSVLLQGNVGCCLQMQCGVTACCCSVLLQCVDAPLGICESSSKRERNKEREREIEFQWWAWFHDSCIVFVFSTHVGPNHRSPSYVGPTDSPKIRGGIIVSSKTPPEVVWVMGTVLWLIHMWLYDSFISYVWHDFYMTHLYRVCDMIALYVGAYAHEYITNPFHIHNMTFAWRIYIAYVTWLHCM